MMVIGPLKITQGTDFGTDQKPVRNFLLMNNTNLCPNSEL